MSFSGDLHNFKVLVDFRTRGVFTGTVQEVYTSIVSGSPITASPGQPVDTGALRASWQVQYEDENTATISTNMEYAQPIEDGVGRWGPMHLRSAVGGWHSVRLTVLGMNRIVSYVNNLVGGK